MPHAPGNERDISISMHDQHLGVFRVFGRRRMNMQVTKAATERDVLLQREILVSKKQHQMLSQRFLEGAQRRVIERSRKVDARYCSANHGRHGSDMKRKCHRVFRLP